MVKYLTAAKSFFLIWLKHAKNQRFALLAQISI